jgi:tRNA modification GTPase
LEFERSIVDVKKGTTRDFVSEERRISSVPVTFIDTAGLAETEKSIEKEGVQRTKDLIKKGNIIVWVTAADEEIKNVEREIKVEKNQKILGVINKIDLSDGIEKENMFIKYSVPHIKIVATDKNERGKAEKFIVDQIAEMLRSVQYDCIISNKRQERIIEDIYREILEIEKRMDQEEIISLHYRNILEKIEEYVGKSTNDEVLDRIFDEFCIGK